ncbi:MAG: hypothetical protein HC819_09845 [Cyclobacteriaceae bacterium]|nr:hypothetical protein [Cyclobacteriaceae bacterium]
MTSSIVFTSKILLPVFALAICMQAIGQDAHYWSEQYGNKSMLLSGTVNASVEDLGLVFYNPGRLAQIANPSFVISAKVYELTKTSIKDGLGKGKDLNKSSFGGAPNLVAGTFKIPKLKNHHFAYSFLTRFRSQADFNSKASSPNGQTVNEEYYTELSGQLKSINSLNEEWYGLTWSHALNSKVSVGVTTFGFQRRSNALLNLQLQGLKTNRELSIYIQERDINYNALGILWKGGIAAQLGFIDLGLTVTTPKIKISGKGNTSYENYQSGLDSLAQGTLPDVYIRNSQDDLKLTYKSAWAIGTGISFHFKKSILHVTNEFYSKIAEYTMMDASTFAGQQPRDTINFHMTDKLRAAFNFGIGYEHHFSDKLIVYGSFATDYSTVDNESGYLFQLSDQVSHSKFDGDLYHFGGGISWDMPWAEITLGATYAFSERTIPRPLNIGDENVLNSNEPSSLLYNRWQFLIGFSFHFADKLVDKLNLNGILE